MGFGGEAPKILQHIYSISESFYWISIQIIFIVFISQKFDVRQLMVLCPYGS